MRPIFVFFPLYFILLGCQNSDDAAAGVLATTAKESYTVGEGVTITITNKTGQIIQLQTCCIGNLVFYVDRLESGIWSLYKTQDIPCVKDCPSFLITVRPSETHQTNVSPVIDESGTYRLRFLFSVEGNATTQEFISNSFTVN